MKPAEEGAEPRSTNPSRSGATASDAHQEATWCERGQINATKQTFTWDRCFLNGTHTQMQIHTCETILGPLLISSFSCVRGFPRHPAHACTYTQKTRQTRGGVGGGGLERASTEEDGGRGTHADKPDNRQETLESSRGYFPSSALLSGPRAGKEITNNTH